MAKTKPIGVRFDEPTLDRLKSMGYVSPQGALSFLEKFWGANIGKVVSENNTPENKERIIKERGGCKPEASPPKKIRTLQQLKDLCPKELTGFEKSEWIRDNRVKYGV